MASEIISMGGAQAPSAEQVALNSMESDEAVQDAEIRRFEVPASMHGWRIDRALAGLVPEFSRSYLQQLMAGGAVLSAGLPALKPSARVGAGQALQVELRPTQQAMAFVPQSMSLDIVFEDQHMIVLNKPAGLVVHPAAGNWSGTLLNGLLAHHAAAAQLPRAGIVHRLDKDTSGLMLVGKSRLAVEGLVRAIAAREVHREYLALAHGRWNGAESLDVTQPIGRDVHNRLRMAVIRPDQTGGKIARTTIRLLDGGAQTCLVACKLHTGRTHQIRVHMAWLGHPLIGDTLYGGKPELGMQRQALHATRLRLSHPVSGESLEFRCPVPADFQAALHEASLQYNEAQLG